MEVCEALKENSVCVRFDMAGVAASDKVGKVRQSWAKHRFSLMGAFKTMQSAQTNTCIYNGCTHWTQFLLPNQFCFSELGFGAYINLLQITRV